MSEILALWSSTSGITFFLINEFSPLEYFYISRTLLIISSSKMSKRWLNWFEVFSYFDIYV